MKFVNAYKGVKKLYFAALLSIIAAIVVLVGAVVAAVNDSEPSLLTAGGLVLGGGIISLVVFIVQLVGLNQAGQDEHGFSMAFYLIIFGIVLDFIASLLASFNNDVVKTIGKYFFIVVDIMSLLAMEFTFRGIVNLAHKYQNKPMVDTGHKLIIAIWVLFLSAIVLSLLGQILSNIDVNWLKVLVGVLAIVSSISEVVVSIITVVYYGQAKKMLE